MVSLYRYGGYGNAEERPERRIGFAGDRVPSVHCLFFCLPETKALNLGVWGKAPSLQRIDPGCNITVVFLR